MSRVGFRNSAALVLSLAALIAGGPFAFAQNNPSQDSAAQSTPTQGTEDPLKRPLTEKQKKQSAKSLHQELSKTYKKWLDEDVRYIISDEEQKAFKMLSNDE